MFTSNCLTCVLISNSQNILASISMMFFFFFSFNSDHMIKSVIPMCNKSPHGHSLKSVRTNCLASLWLTDVFEFPFPGGCRSGLVSANPDPGESNSFGLGRERSSGSSQDRIRKDCCVCCTCHTAHSFLQTGDCNTNLGNSDDKQSVTSV